MSFKAILHTSGEHCDKCRKPMDEFNPGVELHGSSPENGKSNIWVHISELQKALNKVNLESQRKGDS